MAIIREYISRKTVLVAVGGWRRLKHLESTGQLVRHYPLGIKHARYRRAELQRVLDALPAASS